MTEQGFDRGYDEHKRQQSRRIARNTTPTQRIAWLEDALRLVYGSGIDYLEYRRRKMKEEGRADWGRGFSE